MDGKLKKTGNDYKLYAQDDSCIAVSWYSPYQRLSKKNCEAVANGYDLDDKISKHLEKNDIEASTKRVDVIKSLILELLGGKKFSEEDMKKAIHFGASWREQLFNGTTKTSELFESLQQTEWDVEIEMICPHPEDTYVCGIQYGCGEDGCYHPNQIPYLDKDGCLILTKKKS